MQRHSLLKHPFSQFKIKKSFDTIKKKSEQDLGKKNSIDIEKASHQNSRAIKQRLKKLTAEEILLFERLIKKDYILHHTTTSAVVQSIIDNDHTLRDPHDIIRYSKKSEEKHTPDFCGIENNIFFGLGTRNSSIPVFTRLQKDHKTNEEIDYATIKINLTKMRKSSPESSASLWSSGHFHHFHQFEQSNILLSEFTLGKTTLTWKYAIESALTEEQRYVKYLIFSEKGKEKHRLTIGISDEIALGNDLLPFLAFSFIERLRYVDPTILTYLVEHPNDDITLDRLFEIFFRVDEFEAHIPANFVLDDSYTEIITPEKRKAMTSAVSTAAAEGNIEKLKELQNKYYPMDGYMYADSYHYDHSPPTDLPIVSAIKAKQYKTIEWLLAHGVNRDCFESKEGSQKIIEEGIESITTIVGILRIAAETNDLAMVRFIIEKCGLQINSYYQSSLYTFISNQKISRFEAITQLAKTFEAKSSEVKYDSKKTDIVYKGLLNSNIKDPAILEYLISQLNYCKNEAFESRQLFDIAAFGNEWSCQKMKALPDYEKHKDQLLKIAKDHHNYASHLAIIEDDPDACLEALEKLTYNFNRAFADKLVIALKAEEHPRELRRRLTDEWIVSLLSQTIGYVYKQADILDRVEWVIERLGVKPDEIIHAYFKSYNLIAYCCYHGCFDKAKQFIEEGFPAHYAELGSNSSKRLYNPLYYALAKGNLEFAKYILTFTGVLFPKELDLLSDIVYSKSLDTMQFVLEKGNVDLKEICEERFKNPLEIALCNNQLEMADLLLKHGAYLKKDTRFSIEYDVMHIVEFSKSEEPLAWLEKNKIISPRTFNWKEFKSQYEIRFDETYFLILKWLVKTHTKQITEFMPLLFRKDWEKTIQFCNDHHILLAEELEKYSEVWMDELMQTANDPASFTQLFQWLKEHISGFIDTFKWSFYKKRLFGIVESVIQSTSEASTQVLSALLALDLDKTVLNGLLYSACSMEETIMFGHEPRREDIILLLKYGANPESTIDSHSEKTIYQWVLEKKPLLKDLFLPYLKKDSDEKPVIKLKERDDCPVFITTASPKKEDNLENTGDVDYAKTIATSLQKQSVDATYLYGASDEKEIYKEIIAKTPKDSPAVLHIMVNAPNTGFAFSPDGIKQFKQETKATVTMTILEFAKHEHASLKMSTLDRMNEADHLIFLDTFDRESALAFSKEQKHSSLIEKIEKAAIIPVPATVKSLPKDAKHGGDIISFGMIRKGKGLAHVTHLAELIKKSEDPLVHFKKIHIVGTVQKQKTRRNKSAYDRSLYDLMSAIYPTKKSECYMKTPSELVTLLKSYQQNPLLIPALPIELHIDIPQSDLQAIFGKCTYSYLPAYRGATLRNSSLSTSFANGFVTISHITKITPPELLPSGEFHDAIHLIKNTQYLGYAEQVLENIKKREQDPDLNKKTQKEAERLVDNVLSVDKIAMAHLDVYTKKYVNKSLTIS